MPLVLPPEGDPPRYDKPRPGGVDVTIPMALYNAMALCFYGEGPRFWELDAKPPSVMDLSPHPEAPIFPGTPYVTDTPPGWQRVTTDDGPDDVQTTA